MTDQIEQMEEAALFAGAALAEAIISQLRKQKRVGLWFGNATCPVCGGPMSWVESKDWTFHVCCVTNECLELKIIGEVEK